MWLRKFGQERMAARKLAGLVFVVAFLFQAVTATVTFNLFNAILVAALVAAIIALSYAAFRATFRPTRDPVSGEKIKYEPIPWEFSLIMFALGFFPTWWLGRALVAGTELVTGQARLAVVSLLVGFFLALFATRARMSRRKTSGVPSRFRLPLSSLEKGGVMVAFLGTVALMLGGYGPQLGLKVHPAPGPLKIALIFSIGVGAALVLVGRQIRVVSERSEFEADTAAEAERKRAAIEDREAKQREEREERAAAQTERRMEPHRQDVLEAIHWYDKQRPTSPEAFEAHVRAQQGQYLKNAERIKKQYVESPFAERRFREEVGKYAVRTWSGSFARQLTTDEVAHALAAWWGFRMDCLSRAQEMAEGQKLGIDYPKVIERWRFQVYLEAQRDKIAAIREERDRARVEATRLYRQLIDQKQLPEEEAWERAHEEYEILITPVRSAVDESRIDVPFDLEAAWDGPGMEEEKPRV